MRRLKTKIWKPLLASAAGLLLLAPTLAVAATGDSYYWQSPSRTGVVQVDATGSATNFAGSGANHQFTAPAASCDNNSPTTGPDQISVSNSDYAAKNDPTVGTLDDGCGNTDSVNIYATKAEASTAATASNSDGSTCKGGVLAYLLCPVYSFILSSIQSVEQKVIVPFLQIQPIAVGQTSAPSFLIWQQFRNLADIGFIIAFLVMIFATTLSVNLDSYTLKKMLPRLVIAAIAVQFSYTLVAFGVDVTNIIGGGLQSLILSPLRGHSTVLINNVVGGAGIIGIAAGIAAALSAAGGLISGTLLIVLLGAFFAVIAVFLTLVARQILITLLLITAPLAFVAWILPNTEHLFKLWRTTLLRLLMMYPMIVLLFASGKLFSAAAASGGLSGPGSSTLGSLLSVVAGVVPLFFIPQTFKYAGSALTTINGWITSATKGTRSRIESTEGYERFKNRAQQRRTELAAGQKIKGFGAITGNQLTARMGQGVSGVASGWVGNKRQRAEQRATQQVRAMVAFNKNTNDWKKRLEDENMTYEGFTYLSLGDQWYNDTMRDSQRDLEAARTRRDFGEVAIQEATQRRMVAGRAEARRYFRSTEARAAAALLRSGFDLATGKDREALLDYTSDIEASRMVQRQMWGRIKEGSRKVNVHLAYMDVDGNLNAEELRKNVAKKSSGDWVNYSKDAIEEMAKPQNGVLQKLSQDAVTRQVLINTLSSTGGPSIGAEQQAIIRQALKDNPYPGNPNDIKDDVT